MGEHRARLDQRLDGPGMRENEEMIGPGRIWGATAIL